MSEIDHALIARILRITGDARAHDAVIWTDRLQFYADATNVFWPQSSDTVFNARNITVEPITAANIDQFEKAFADVMAATGGDPTYAPCLFAARVRGVRPRNAHYPTDHRLWPLFDAAGPEVPDVDEAAQPVVPANREEITQ